MTACCAPLILLMGNWSAGRMMVSVATMAHSGCATTEERLARAEATDDAACRTQASRCVNYSECRHLRIAYRQAEEAADIQRQQAAGAALQNAWIALMAISQQPVTPVPMPPA